MASFDLQSHHLIYIYTGRIENRQESIDVEGTSLLEKAILDLFFYWNRDFYTGSDFLGERSPWIGD
jgi:hypothetical protein